MYYGDSCHLQQSQGMDPRFQRWVEQAMLLAKDQTNGKYPLDDNGVFVILADDNTQTKHLRKAEVHQQYIDIQILLEGEEAIGYNIEQRKELLANLVFNNDVSFIDEIDSENMLTLARGQYAIFFPGEIHRPLCTVRHDQRVRKAIVKIPVTLMNAA
ncbi:YhcH/YjgK/YiaL family protein [Agarivorans gilvus]|uniref:YhcH/YjgK/YiaL family protein n=1 Tax=Agarivorans gilvus TaxID=680279 RepID=A0ABQ1I3C6_9ALTE|nr:YhcH/YjgK/YiaL family protein [Agarivorans gilvus]GGB11052.1 hypothetical protein GCM10007414_25630 [Agarivorans gilvus]